MAASGHRGGRIAQIPPLGGSVSAAGRAGGIVLGGVRQDGQLVQRVESACENYDATLLLGAQRDADGNLFRFSNAGIRTLNITDGALPDTDAAALSAPVKDNSRF